MGKIFDIRLVMSGGEWLDRFRAAKDPEVWNELTREKARSVAEFVRERMSDVLSKGHQFKVGATGKASQNLEVIPSETSQGYASFGIIELKGYKANYFIRRGFKGTKEGSNRHIPLDKLKVWAAAKGVHLYTPGTEEKDPYARFVRQRVGRGQNKDKYYVRRLRKSRTPEVNAGLYALAKYLEENGSKWSHWRGLYPGGSPRFDYVVYTLRHEQAIRRAMKRAAGELVQAYVEYVASGKRKATERFYDAGDIRRRK